MQARDFCQLDFFGPGKPGDFQTKTVFGRVIFHLKVEIWCWGSFGGTRTLAFLELELEQIKDVFGDKT